MNVSGLKPPKKVEAGLAPANNNNYDYSEEDFFKPIKRVWRKKVAQEKLHLKIKFDHSMCIESNTYMKLKKCIAKNKVTILPDGNCLFRALSWWLTEKEDFHGLVRIKLVEFMRKSALCERYVRISRSKA